MSVVGAETGLIKHEHHALTIAFGIYCYLSPSSGFFWRQI